MLHGGAIVRLSLDVRGQDQERLWAHLVYEMGEKVEGMKMWEMSTGVAMLEVEYVVVAPTEAKYEERLEEERGHLVGLLSTILEQRVTVADFLKYSPLPPGRKRIGLMRPKGK